MALRIRSWNKWQGAQVNAVKRNRRKKKHAEGAPYSMQAINLCTQLERDGDFRVFAREIGPRNALTFFVRIIMAAGVADGMKGAIDINRSELGRWVLSTPDDRVGRKLGEKTYDALIIARLCTEFSTGLSPVSRPGSDSVSRPVRVGGHCDGMGRDETNPDPGLGRPESSDGGSPSTSPDGSVSPPSGYAQFHDAATNLAGRKSR